LLESDNYITRRRSLKLLSEILLDHNNYNFMMSYISSRGNLKIVMNLLRHKSSAQIQLEAFHIFKVFVANPKKASEVEEVLSQNKARLIAYLQPFHSYKDKDDPQFVDEKRLLLDTLALLKEKDHEPLCDHHHHHQGGKSSTSTDLFISGDNVVPVDVASIEVATPLVTIAPSPPLHRDVGVSLAMPTYSEPTPNALKPPTASVVHAVESPTASVVHALEPPTASEVHALEPPTASVDHAVESPTTSVVHALEPPTASVVYAVEPPTASVYALESPTASVVHAQEPPTVSVYALEPPTASVDHALESPTASVVHALESPTASEVHALEPPTASVDHALELPTASVVHDLEPPTVSVYALEPPTASEVHAVESYALSGRVDAALTTSEDTDSLSRATEDDTAAATCSCCL